MRERGERALEEDLAERERERFGSSVHEAVGCYRERFGSPG